MAEDPLRSGLIEALARRAAQHEGPVRRVLDARLAQLMAESGEQGACPSSTPIAAGPRRPPAAPGPLARLAQEIDARAGVVAGATGRPTDLKALSLHRSAWARVSVDLQLSRSRGEVPENAGPLNANRIVLGALQAMRELSPAYLDRFLSYVDGLQWLETAGGAAPWTGAVAREESSSKRKPSRAKPRR